MTPKFTVAEFFAGSGLVRLGLNSWFETIWANDISTKKAVVYHKNFGEKELLVRSIKEISGTDVPPVDLAWASFPCQDLSLAGKLAGLPDTSDGSRSGLFWEWLRILDEMPKPSRPAVLAIENVVGFLVSKNGENFARAYHALRKRDYLVGALVIDAAHFVPQSRPRSFIVAVQDSVSTKGLTLHDPNHVWHPKSVLTAYNAVADSKWLWWDLPSVKRREKFFWDICDYDEKCDSAETTNWLISMLSPLNRKKLEKIKALKGRFAGTGYKRMRPSDKGGNIQRLEIRFDGIAGCLRTSGGGSSRQIVIIVEDGKVRTRLLTVKEAALLMGANKNYVPSMPYSDGYHAMGDAVAVPAVKFLAKNLLHPLCSRIIASSLAPAAE